MDKEILYAERLTTDHPSEQNIDHISFSLRQGEILAVTGLHDSGLSALAAALCGQLPICGGVLYIGDQPVKLISYKQGNQFGIYQITQASSIVSNLSISENMNILQMQDRRRFIINPKINLETTRAVFDHYGIIGDPDGYPDSLSSGAQMQLAICRSVICGARILICHSIGEGLSEDDTLSLQQFLKKLRDEGIAILFITNDMRKALAVSDRVAVMRHGLLCYDMETSAASSEEIVRCMAMQNPPSVIPVDIPIQSSKIFLQDLALPGREDRRFSAELCGGKAVGLFWSNGSYGDLLKRMFSGLVPSNGTVRENDMTQPFCVWRQENRHRISCLGIRFWERNLIENMTVAENILLRTYYHFNSRFGMLNDSMLRLALQEFAKTHKIDLRWFQCYPRHLPPELRNQVVLWSVLLAPPKLLVLDCPMFAMDEQIRHNYLSCLDELKSMGTAILWSDNGESPKYYCDHCITV